MALSVVPDFLRWRGRRQVDPSEDNDGNAAALSDQTAPKPPPVVDAAPVDVTPAPVNVTAPGSTKPDAGGPYLTRAEAGDAPPMAGVRPGFQHNPADASEGDAVKDYLSAVRAARLRPEKEDFNSGDQATDLEDRQATLEAYQPQKRSWWQNVKANIMPALIGAGATDSPYNALGRVIGGVAVGTVDRKSADKLWRNRQLAETGAELASVNAQTDEALKRRKTVADIGATEASAKRSNAEAYKALHPAPDFDRLEGEDGFYVYDKNNPTAAPIKLPVQPKSKDEKPSAFTWLGRRYEWAKDPNTKQWKAQEVEGLPVDESEVPVDYMGYKVKPGVAATGEASITAANVSSGNQYGNQSYEDAVKEQERQFQDEQAKYNEGLAARSRVVNAYGALNKAIARRDGFAKDIENARAGEASADPAAKQKATQARLAAEANFKEADGEAAAARATLEAESRAAEATGYVKSHPQTGWATELLPRPQRPQPPARPAPRQRPSGRGTAPHNDPLGLFQ